MGQPERVTTEQIKRHQNKIDAADTLHQKNAAVIDAYHDLYDKGCGYAVWALGVGRLAGKRT